MTETKRKQNIIDESIYILICVYIYIYLDMLKIRSIRNAVAK